MLARRRPFLWGLVGTVLMFATFFLLTLALTMLLTGKAGVADSAMKIAIVPIEGVISSDLAEHAVRQLTKYADDPSIKAIVIRIDSPGGGVAASQEIYEGVKRLRADGKLVVASLGSLAASGGYYVACAADRIFTNPGTLTGSIGVIVQLANAQGFLRKVGIESTAITSGPFKDSGSPARPLRPEEREVFQTLVDDVYRQFVDAVAQGRHLEPVEVRRYADGRVYTGQQAKAFKLVDDLGTLQDAIAYAASTIGVAGKPKLVQEGRERLWWLKFVLESVRGYATFKPFSVADSVLQYRWPY